MFTRRAFVLSSFAAPALLRGASLTPKQRIDRVLKGHEPDRTPFTIWHHFLDEKAPGAQHAESTLAYHKKFKTDLVKVMSDYPYPKPAGEWFDVKVSDNPFPQQIEALRLIREGLNGDAHFVETMFNPYQVAEKLSSKEAVEKMKSENPQRLLDALEVIAKSEANHARNAINAGASGVFLSITTSADADYARFGEPFDKIVMQAVSSAPLNVLHIHGRRIDLPRFYEGWPASVINYSIHGTMIAFTWPRKRWNGVLMGGLDEDNFRHLTDNDVRRQFQDAKQDAGNRFILAGGCSVPNDSTDEEQLRVPRLLGA